MSSTTASTDSTEPVTSRSVRVGNREQAVTAHDGDTAHRPQAEHRTEAHAQR